jgi:2-polyprenyl-3-methyl-5-hydroxy-6-metoxy-1,4-benzoquinol methylase
MPASASALTGFGYVGVRPEVQEAVPRGAQNILELGCSNGTLGGAIKARQPTKVFGVELVESYSLEAQERLDRAVCADAEEFVKGPMPEEGPFDSLIAADVLEHLVDPWETLRGAVAMLSPGATVVVSLPNVFYWKAMRKALKQRSWPRESVGIFDSTHIRWFTPKDARGLLEGAGLTVVAVENNYWTEGWTLKLSEGLMHTPLADFMPAQVILSGVVPGVGLPACS